MRVSGPWTDALDATGAYVPLLARSLNVSEAGMALATPVLLDEGVSVTCSLRLGQAPVYLHGQVVWRQAPAHVGEPRRIGIRFQHPSDADLGPLRACLGRLGGRLPVRLHFAGLPEPVFALAESEGDDLELAAPLSLLSEGHAVELEFAESGERFPAQVRDVRMDQRGETPVLRARVTVAQTRQRALRRTLRTAGPQRRKRMRRRLEHLVAGLVGFAMGAGLWWWEARTPGSARTAAVTDYAAATLAASPAAPRGPAATRHVTAAAANTSNAAQASHAAQAEAHTPSTSPAITGAASTGQGPASPAPIGPLVERLRGERVVKVPTAGRPEVGRVYRLADPPGVGVHVHGQVALPDGRYPILRDRMLWLRVRELPELQQTQVRLFLHEPPESAEVEAQPRALRLRLSRP